MSTEAYWKPIMLSPQWLWGKEEVSHWELVTTGDGPLSTRFTGVYAQPNGRLVIDGDVLQFASVEEAKEIGMSTYLLTKEEG